MADSSFPELPQECNDDVLELNKDLDRMIENAEKMSVQLTLMAYDMVVLRTNPELGASLVKLEEAYHRLRAALSGNEKTEMNKYPAPTVAAHTGSDMEDTEKSAAWLTTCTDLENVLQKLDALSNCMDQLALRSQLKLCDLIICVGHPEKLAYEKFQEALKQQQQQPPSTN